MRSKLLFCLIFILAQPGKAADLFTYSVERILYTPESFIYPVDTSRLVTIGHTFDLNQDGNMDLIVGTGTNLAFEARESTPDLVLINDGDNTFTMASGDKVFTDAPRQLQVFDFDGDGSLDIYSSTHGYDAPPFPGEKDALLLGGASGYTDASDRLPDIPAFSHDAATADIDNDGDLDILVLNNELGDVNEVSYLLMNDGTGQFAVNKERLPQDMVNPAPFETQFSWAAHFADLDNDGWQDLIIGRLSVNSNQPRLPTRVHWNQGNGTFTDSDVTVLPFLDNYFEEAETEVNEITSYDFNSDGNMDLLVTSIRSSSFSGRGVQMLINQGNRVFTDESIKRLGPVSRNTDTTKRSPYFFEFVDINKDGYIDIVPEFSEDQSDDSPIIWEGTGYGCFNPVVLSEITQDGNARPRIANGVPIFSSSGLSYIETYIGKFDDGSDRVGYNQVDITITENPKVPVYLDNCSGLLRTYLDAGEFGKMSLDFTIVQTSPSVLIQAASTSARMLNSLPLKHAEFNPVNQTLRFPELVVNDDVAYTDLEFRLVDPVNLIFELEP